MEYDLVEIKSRNANFVERSDLNRLQLPFIADLSNHMFIGTNANKLYVIDRQEAVNYRDFVIDKYESNSKETNKLDDKLMKPLRLTKE